MRSGSGRDQVQAAAARAHPGATPARQAPRPGAGAPRDAPGRRRAPLAQVDLAVAVGSKRCSRAGRSAFRAVSSSRTSVVVSVRVGALPGVKSPITQGCRARSETIACSADRRARTRRVAPPTSPRPPGRPHSACAVIGKEDAGVDAHHPPLAVALAALRSQAVPQHRRRILGDSNGSPSSGAPPWPIVRCSPAPPRRCARVGGVRDQARVAQRRKGVPKQASAETQHRERNQAAGRGQAQCECDRAPAGWPVTARSARRWRRCTEA